MKISENGMKVIETRYAHEGESARDVFTRVATHIASVEKTETLKLKWKDRFFKLMANLNFLPNTPCLANAGKPNGQLSACFVIPVEDDVEAIFDAIKWTAMVHKTGGGTGFSFSKLRPDGSTVRESGGIASGPVSFMRVFNAATGEMKQGGLRRGANMGILRVDHPDIMEFIHCKRVEGEFSNFNLSVGITDNFMECLRTKKPFILGHKSPDGVIAREIDPQEIWDAIINGAWENGEPGVVFLDAINEDNLLSGIETLDATNPCAEQPLPDFGSCTLGSINLSNMFHNLGSRTTNNPMDMIFKGKLKTTVSQAVRFLDNTIDANHYVLKQFKDEALSKRRIGLGIMGLADLLIKMKIRYGSTESFEVASNIMKLIDETAVQASERLGEEKFRPPLLTKHVVTDAIGKSRRNGLLTTIAPTGSISIVAGVSSGCEPVFSFNFEKVCIETKIDMIHPLAMEFIKTHPNEELPSYFVEARDIPPQLHLRMQQTLQKYTHSGISKTINAPHDINRANVSLTFMSAYEIGLKSIAFYREGSRKYEAQAAKDQKLETPNVESAKLSPKATDAGHESPRPVRLPGTTTKIMTGRGKLYVTVNEDQGRPFEVFLKIGKSGREDFAYSEALGRMISLAFRNGVSVTKIVKHLEGISGADFVWDDGQQIKSVPDAVARVLTGLYIDTMELENDSNDVDSITVCPECGRLTLITEGNCITCPKCGWSKCS